MRYVKTTKIEHSLELDGDELQDFLRGELRTESSDIIDPPDPEPLRIEAIIPAGSNWGTVPIDRLTFLALWEEETEEVEE